MKTLVILGLLCVLATSACITRQDAVNRGMEWVNAKVPYNASAYHGGYVQGCEGIVGYAWLFPKPGIYSGDLIHQGACKQVPKDQLAMGDIMVCPGSHQLLFHSWANTQKTYYWAIELGGSSGSQKHEIPYPYWPNYNPSCYIPCKVTKACVTEENEGVEQLLQTE